mmetsp:Transcript_9197/g.16109  ORF Transcript_9197/g.16109 Transcript_9197/m.16109 type:complete len:85 (-) Transcript_9197:257-511(-)
MPLQVSKTRRFYSFGAWNWDETLGRCWKAPRLAASKSNISEATLTCNFGKQLFAVVNLLAAEEDTRNRRCHISSRRTDAKLAGR